MPHVLLLLQISCPIVAVSHFTVAKKSTTRKSKGAVCFFFIYFYFLLTTRLRTPSTNTLTHTTHPLTHRTRNALAHDTHVPHYITSPSLATCATTTHMNSLFVFVLINRLMLPLPPLLLPRSPLLLLLLLPLPRVQTM